MGWLRDMREDWQRDNGYLTQTEKEQRRQRDLDAVTPYTRGPIPPPPSSAPSDEEMKAQLASLPPEQRELLFSMLAPDVAAEAQKLMAPKPKPYRWRVTGE